MIFYTTFAPDIVKSFNMQNDRINKVLSFLESNGITYKMHTHPPLPTIELALEYWKEIDSTHCKNLFFRNHKATDIILWSLSAIKSFPSTL